MGLGSRISMRENGTGFKELFLEKGVTVEGVASGVTPLTLTLIALGFGWGGFFVVVVIGFGVWNGCGELRERHHGHRWQESERRKVSEWWCIRSWQGEACEIGWWDC